MGLETGTYISDLVATNPLGSDAKSQGDDHIRLIKSTVKASFTGVSGACTATHTELNRTIALQGRNKIINGNFDRWARQTSQTTSGYGSDDRWQNAHNGSTKTHSQQAFTVGQTDVPNNPTYYSRTVVTSSAGAGNYCYKRQLVEGVRTFSGETVTLTFYAKADASKNIAVEFLQDFGTGGGASAQETAIGVTTCALTTSWTKFTITKAITSISTKTIGTSGTDYLAVFFWFDAGSTYNSRTSSLGQQSGTFDIAQVQLEKGSVATAFETLPMAMVNDLCDRYYERQQTAWGQTYPVDSALYSRHRVDTSAVKMYFSIDYKAIKRAAPTCAIRYDLNDGAAADATISAGGITGMTGEFTPGATGFTDINDWYADAELQ